MDYLLSPTWCALGQCLGMLLLLEIGRRLGARRIAKDAEGSHAAVTVVEGAIFGLIGLLLAFTFSGASTRFHERQRLIAEEANAIGTAYLRLDLLPLAQQPALREQFRRYLDTRLEAYRKLPDIPAALETIARAAGMQREIWAQAVAACKMETSPPATMLVLPALNAMIDITTSRSMAGRLHPPLITYLMLFVLLLAGALLVGYDSAGGKKRNWLHIVGFTLAMAVAVFVIIDIEFPRLGLIRLDAADSVLDDVRESMK